MQRVDSLKIGKKTKIALVCVFLLLLRIAFKSQIKLDIPKGYEGAIVVAYNSGKIEDPFFVKERFSVPDNGILILENGMETHNSFKSYDHNGKRFEENIFQSFSMLNMHCEISGISFYVGDISSDDVQKQIERKREEAFALICKEKFFPTQKRKNL